ncbi:hypothetical protein JYU34_010165 [Plutella xylostella]|uniref:Uncharacterized protein n=1 Tax=Plutella xylostella TaxID=51655 RepID=A0ABQ7QHV9_PLUXY|nr:hypothetical protein JYU34_010165 [Plutella xylostella]
MFELSSLFLCFLLTVSNGQDITQQIQQVQNIMNNSNGTNNNNLNNNANQNANNGLNMMMNMGTTNMPNDAASIWEMDRRQENDEYYYKKKGYGDREYEYKDKDHDHKKGDEHKHHDHYGYNGNGYNYNGYNNYGFNNYNQGNGNFDRNNNQTIIRPCYDISCVRKYFADHSKCKPVYGHVPEPYYRPQANYLLSFFNLTVTSTGIHYRGLQGVIQDFYLDRQTDRAVLTLLFRNYRLNSTVDYYRYHRAGKEPAITKSFGATYFPSLTTTTIFRGIHKLDLQTSDTTGYVDGVPVAVVDPSAGNHPDPVVQRTFAAFLAGLLIAVQEALLTESPWAAATFIEHTICDFGLRVFVNRKSALTILAVDFQNVTLNVREVIVRYHRRGQQAIVTNSTLDRERYASFTTTTVFNGFAELQLENSETTAYVDSPPAVIVGPELGVHPDPTIALRFAAFIANLPIITQENFLTSAPFYASTFIQYVLCDFGLMIK